MTTRGMAGGTGGQLNIRRKGETLRAVNLEMRLLSLGRTPDNGLPLADPGVAIRHAELARTDDGQLILTDLGNGLTFLNGRRLSAHAPSLLEDGDEIQIGPFTLTYSGESFTPPLEFIRVDVNDVRERLKVHPLRPPRQAQRLPDLPGSASTYMNYLPGLFEESEFVGRYLRIFENIWEPLQHRQDHIAMYFDARTSPPEFLDWLSGWLGLHVDHRWPEQRQRDWVRESINLYRWRGTRYGLSRALEIACGVTPALIEDPKVPHRLRVVVPQPPGDDPELARVLVEDIVSQHAPAHVHYDLEFVDLPPNDQLKLDSGPSGAGPAGEHGEQEVNP